MKTTILIFGLVMYLLMVNSEVVITNTDVEGHNVPVTLTISDTATAGKRGKIAVSITATEMFDGNDFPIACFPNDVDNAIPEGADIPGFTLDYDPEADTTDPSEIRFWFMEANLTEEDGNFNYEYRSIGSQFLDVASPDVTWTGGVLSHTYEVDDTFTGPLAIDSSITAAICIFGNDLTVDIGAVAWGFTDLDEVNLNEYATMVYWTPPVATETTQDVGGMRISGFQTVAKIGTFVLGVIAWIL